jgi:FkbM family methyltransferase
MEQYKKIFIDCGYHLGEGLNEFTSLLSINDSWEVYAFEANTACDIFNKIINHPYKVTAYNSAVWTHNNGVLFNQENNKKNNSPLIGSTSYIDGWGSCVSELQSSHTFETQITVPSIDFSQWIKQFKNHEVYCKMDIEGAEFPVLRKMINDDTIKLVNTLWVEWHDIDLPNESESSRNELIKNISCFTKLNSWK